MNAVTLAVTLGVTLPVSLGGRRRNTFAQVSGTPDHDGRGALSPFAGGSAPGSPRSTPPPPPDTPLPPHRINARAQWLESRLSKRDWAILDTLYRVGTANSGQLERLHFTGLSQAVYLRKRALSRLVKSGALNATPRRIGGPLGGSQQRIYSLDPAAQLLMKMLIGAPKSEPMTSTKAPTPRLVTHALTVTELYVRCVEFTRDRHFTVDDFQGEPQCWWPLDNRRFLKPDAHLRFANLATETIDNWWLEIDLGSERNPAVREKFERYLAFYTSGERGPNEAVPRVLMTTPDNARATTMRRIQAQLKDPTRSRIYIKPFNEAVDFLADFSNTPLGPENTTQKGTSI